MDAVLPRAAAAGVLVEIDATAAVARKQHVLSDGFLMRQALINLLKNAIAFSPQGSTVKVRTQLHDEQLQLLVADRTSYALERVFERFCSLARPQSGQLSSGLGLPFVGEVARLHAGEATLGNREGGGAVAALQLPSA